jgi:hypothetical protein
MGLLGFARSKIDGQASPLRCPVLPFPFPYPAMNQSQPAGIIPATRNPALVDTKQSENRQQFY